ncbi:MAG: HEPN domain-containing protein [Candidatus Schekmanbacteria bacterium]|nr:HEPN domain-containing protein [Candidatus Schekmanbacteria bacterium]
MSRLRRSNGDDHPDASGKHLADAQALLAAGRFDGAAYLAGYVVECALKSLIQVETKSQPRFTHKLKALHSEVAVAYLVAGAATAKYVTPAVLGIPSAQISGWTEQLRYRGPSFSSTDAQAWVAEASQIYADTIAQMIHDGVI